MAESSFFTSFVGGLHLVDAGLRSRSGRATVCGELGLAPARPGTTTGSASASSSATRSGWSVKSCLNSS